jgi:quercetin dioxygenase-like cupin family protein
MRYFTNKETATMSTKYKAEDLLRLPGQGEQRGDTIIKARAADLHGQFGIAEAVIEPRMLIAPHSHQHEAQAVFVISGELEFEVGGEGGLRFTAPAGSYVIKPRRVMHTFWNEKDVPARYIELSGGHNFEDFIEDTADADLIKIQKASEMHQIAFDPGYLARLMLKHRLKGPMGLKLPGLGH